MWLDPVHAGNGKGGLGTAAAWVAPSVVVAPARWGGRRCGSGTPDLDSAPAVGWDSGQGVVEEDVQVGSQAASWPPRGSLMIQAARPKKPKTPSGVLPDRG